MCYLEIAKLCSPIITWHLNSLNDKIANFGMLTMEVNRYITAQVKINNHRPYSVSITEQIKVNHTFCVTLNPEKLIKEQSQINNDNKRHPIKMPIMEHSNEHVLIEISLLLI